MNGNKIWWKSKGLWGPAVALLGYASAQAGLGEIDETGVLEAIEQLFIWGGVALAFAGRVLARSKIIWKEEAQ